MNSWNFLALLVATPMSHAFLAVRPGFGGQPRWFPFSDLHTYNSEQDFIENDDGRTDEGSSSDSLFFNDFDYEIGENSHSTPVEAFLGDGKRSTGLSESSASSLQQRMTQLVVNEEQTQKKISQNWKEGNWNVRGCSLDPGDGNIDSEKTTISALCALDEDIVLVGRSDGSVCWLQLGSEYLATFTNRLVAKETSNETIAVVQEMKREEGDKILTENSEITSDSLISSFELLAQLQASQSTILDMVVLDGRHLFVLSPEGIEHFHIGEDGPLSEKLPIPEMNPQSPYVALKAVDRLSLLSVDRYGKVVVRKPDHHSSSVLSEFSIPLEDDDLVLSCEVDDDYLYFGTARGIIWIYSIANVLESAKTKMQAIFLKSFTPFSKDGVSCICSTGEGVMGRGNTRTKGLVTGSTTGQIKQWEIIPQGGSVEFWPKLSSQKIPGKAHLIGEHSYVSSPIAEAILALKTVQEGVLLSATRTQLTIWSSVTGKPFCDMHGLHFIEEGTASCLVLAQSLLVTNGMNQYVCVHDFSIDPDLQVQDMIKPLDDDDSSW